MYNVLLALQKIVCMRAQDDQRPPSSLRASSFLARASPSSSSESACFSSSSVAASGLPFRQIAERRYHHFLVCGTFNMLYGRSARVHSEGKGPGVLRKRGKAPKSIATYA